MAGHHRDARRCPRHAVRRRRRARRLLLVRLLMVRPAVEILRLVGRRPRGRPRGSIGRPPSAQRRKRGCPLRTLLLLLLLLLLLPRAPRGGRVAYGRPVVAARVAVRPFRPAPTIRSAPVDAAGSRRSDVGIDVHLAKEVGDGDGAAPRRRRECIARVPRRVRAANRAGLRAPPRGGCGGSGPAVQRISFKICAPAPRQL